MDLNEQKIPPTPAPSARRSTVVEAAIGGGMGSLVGLITSVFNKKMSRGKQVAIGAAAGAAIGIIQNLFASDTPPTPPGITPIPPIPPVLPPATPTIAGDLQLAHVPQILDMLVERKQLTTEQKASVLQGMKEGRVGFSGEMAVADGFITQKQLEGALAEQCARKAEAAVADIQTLTTMTEQKLGAVAAPANLRANWGNSGINPANPNTSCTYGASAASNNAQNLVMLAFSNTSQDPALMPTIREGVIAAANLTRGIIQGDSAQVPLAKMSKKWRASMNEALRAAAKANPSLVMDAQGTPINIENFITYNNFNCAFRL